MSSGESGTDCCTPPGSAAGAANADQEARLCILCNRKMFFAKEMQVHVCLNKEHGVLAYYRLDDCYFTSRADVGLRLAKEGRKLHMIEPEVLRMIGVEA